MTYAYPNVTDIVGLFAYVNLVSSGLFGLVIILCGWVISFFVSLRWGILTSFTASSFVMAIVSFLLSVAGIVSEQVTLILAVATVAGIAVLWLSD